MTITSFDTTLYQGRCEPFEDEKARYYYQAIGEYHHQMIGLLGFGCDQGVHRNQGRIGAKHAPNVIKTALGKLPISMAVQKKMAVKSMALVDLVGDNGNVICQDDDSICQDSLELAQEYYARVITQMLKNHTLPIGLGGGHEIAYASFMGLYHAINAGIDKKRIGIINLDAHFDLRSDKYATSGTPFLQISQFLQKQNEPFFYLTLGISQFGNTASLFAKADSLGVKVIDEQDCHRLPFEMIAKQLDDFIARVDVLYVTLDLDVLQAGVMPAVSAVNAGGLSLDFVERCLEYIIGSQKVGLIDMAEFNPKYDIDGRGAKVAARLLAMMVQTHFLAVIK